jgi:hypothetical protein
VTTKIIQIAVENGFPTGDKDIDGDAVLVKSYLWALCDDGTLFCSCVLNGKRHWHKIILPESVDVIPSLGE